MVASVVDIFCGAGGLTHGFVLEGFDVSIGVDSDPSCEFPYTYNNKTRFLNQKLEDMSSEEKGRLFPYNADVRILVGCAPCQPFSNYMIGKHNRAENWQLVEVFRDLIIELQPEIVSMENVTSLRSYKGGKVFHSFVDSLVASNYNVWSENVYCPDYGVPQCRSRLVLLASKKSQLTLIASTHEACNHKTVRGAIGELEPIGAGERSTVDPLHCARGLSELNLRRIRQSRPGGTWEDWNEDLVLLCHKRSTGQKYKSVYGRMKWDEPSPTITTQCYAYGSGRFGHPEQDRAISLREAALLQTFPKKYRFIKPGDTASFSRIGRQIGNAVPVTLARAIAKSIRLHMEDHYVAGQ